MSYMCTNVGSVGVLPYSKTYTCNVGTIFVKLYMSNICTVPIVTWLIAMT